MSMIGKFVAVDSEQLRSLIDNPKQILSLLYFKDMDGSSLNKYLDIGKTWHAIHFTLNGDALVSSEPLSLAILGGEGIGEDIGYGPVRYLTPEQVKIVSAALFSMTPDAFSEQFNPAAMDAAGVYPQTWEYDEDEGLEYVLYHYTQLQSFYQGAAERGDAVLLAIT